MWRYAYIAIAILLANSIYMRELEKHVHHNTHWANSSTTYITSGASDTQHKA